jgi:hypothetical protein
MVPAELRCPSGMLVLIETGAAPAQVVVDQTPTREAVRLTVRLG